MSVTMSFKLILCAFRSQNIAFVVIDCFIYDFHATFDRGVKVRLFCSPQWLWQTYHVIIFDWPLTHTVGQKTSTLSSGLVRRPFNTSRPFALRRPLAIKSHDAHRTPTDLIRCWCDIHPDKNHHTTWYDALWHCLVRRYWSSCDAMCWFSWMLWSFVTTLCSPNEDFDRRNKRSQGSSNLSFRLTNSSFGEHKLCKMIQRIVATCVAMCWFSGMRWVFVTTLQDDYKR